MERSRADESRTSDLERRLSKYRTRVAAEGRSRALAEIDRAIADTKSGAAKDTNAS